MKAFLTVVGVLVCTQVLAQEIGTEIPADQQQPSQPTDYDNPYASPPAQRAQPVAPAQQAETPAAAEGATVPGPRKGAFGIRAGFGGAGVPGIVASGGAGATTPTLGFKFMATDSVGLDFELGFALGIASTTQFGFGLGGGLDLYLGSSERSLRPFLTGGLSFGKQFSRLGDDFVLSLNGGGGAEYWFNDSFSLNGELLIGVPLNLKDLDTFVIATFQPGLGATFYF